MNQRDSNVPLSDSVIEKKIQDKGLTAPRITEDYLKSIVATVDYHVFKPTSLTVCCITLINGFPVTGESACASPENFDEEIGRDIAYRNAFDKLWSLEGYLLKSYLYAQSQYDLAMNDEALERYIAGINWDDDTSKREKALVAKWLLRFHQELHARIEKIFGQGAQGE